MNIIGVHYSTQKRSVLDGAFYGTNQAGEELRGVKASKDARLHKRIYFYVDEGQGTFPECGVGKVKHKVELTNLYDACLNELGIPHKDDSFFEGAILDAGYSGYYVRQVFHRQGAAVLLGDAAFINFTKE